MKKIALFFLLMASIHTSTHAQSRNAIFAELGGQGLTFTFNYDFRFQKSPGGLGARVGAGYFRIDNSSITTIPLSLNYLLGKNGKYLELGLGATYGNAELFKSESGSGWIGTMCFGYRLQPVDSGFLFRIGLTPVFSTEGGGYFVPYFGGISVGYTF